MTEALDSPARSPSPLGFSSKVRSHHLQRQAVVYIRQSSQRQLQENVESTQLQYRLADRAAGLGWAGDGVVVIDDDLGLSGASANGRPGFQRLLSEVSLGRVGIVLSIEMSRLARSCRDWHHLLEMCSLFGVLLADADGVYDPQDYNDRLLLGLKGTMSEAELHIMRGRLKAGRLNKAQRGELFAHAPIGYVREQNTLGKEPDEQARQVVDLVFEKFQELGSSSGVLNYLRRHGIQLGVRDHRGENKGRLQWRPVNKATLLSMLHHPVYAGAYVYGRRATDPRKAVAGTGKGRRWASPEDWQVLIKDLLPAYISWERWERNQQILRQNSSSYGTPRGGSLLASRVRCGRCGYRMSIAYAEQSVARYCCDAARNYSGGKQCQAFSAKPLHDLVEQQLMTALAPASIGLSLQAAEEIAAERKRLEDHHRQSVKRAAYESDLARRRYEEVDPENRLVAAELERRWEQSLVEKRRADEDLERMRREAPLRLSAEEERLVRQLSADIPALWNAATTSGTDRQHVVRAVISEVSAEVIDDSERVRVTIHWKGGFESHHEIRRPVRQFESLEAHDIIKERILQLKRRGHTHAGVADDLNQSGYRSSNDCLFTRAIITQLCSRFAMEGESTKAVGGYEDHWKPSLLCAELDVAISTLRNWLSRGWLDAERSGARWIIWADTPELDRLRKLSQHQRTNSCRSTPQELTTPRRSR